MEIARTPNVPKGGNFRCAQLQIPVCPTGTTQDQEGDSGSGKNNPPRVAPPPPLDIATRLQLSELVGSARMTELRNKSLGSIKGGQGLVGQLFDVKFGITFVHWIADAK